MFWPSSVVILKILIWLASEERYSSYFNSGSFSLSAIQQQSGHSQYLLCRRLNCSPACCWPCRWSGRRVASWSRTASLHRWRLFPPCCQRQLSHRASWSGGPSPRLRHKPARNEICWCSLRRGAPPLRRHKNRRQDSVEKENDVACSVRGICPLRIMARGSSRGSVKKNHEETFRAVRRTWLAFTDSNEAGGHAVARVNVAVEQPGSWKAGVEKMERVNRCCESRRKRRRGEDALPKPESCS